MTLITRLVEDDRVAVFHLNYRGKVTRIDPHTPLGPNTLSERLWPVDVDYDPMRDTTRVGLSLIAPPPTTERTEP